MQQVLLAAEGGTPSKSGVCIAPHLLAKILVTSTLVCATAAASPPPDGPTTRLGSAAVAPGGSSDSPQDGSSYPDLACGPSCVAIVLRLLGLPVVNEELQALVDESGDSNFAVMAAYLQSKGLSAVGVKLDPGGLSRLRHFAILQAVAPVRGSDGEEAMHFTVFAGPIDDQKVYLLDPIAQFGPRGPASLELLAEKWTGRALVISRAPANFARVLGTGEAFGVAGGDHAWQANATWAGLTAVAAGSAAYLVRRLSRRRGTGRRRPSKPMALPILIMLLAVGAPAVSADENVKTRAVEIEPDRCDLGTLRSGAAIQGKFVLRNSSAGPVNLRVGKASCSCLTVDMSGPMLVAPGESVTATVTASVTSGGPFQYGVLMHVEGEREPYHLKLSGTLQGDTRFWPQQVDFDDATVGGTRETRTLRVTHVAPVGSEFSIESIDCAAAFIGHAPLPEPTVTPLSPDSVEYAYALEIWCDSTVPTGAAAITPGPFREKLTVRARSGSTPLAFEVPCQGRFVSRVAAKPSKVFRIVDAFPLRTSVEMSLADTEHRAFAVEAVRAGKAELTSWTLQAATAEAPAKLRVELTAKADANRFTDVLAIELSAPERITLQVPVVFLRTEDSDAADR